MIKMKKKKRIKHCFVCVRIWKVVAGTNLVRAELFSFLDFVFSPCRCGNVTIGASSKKCSQLTSRFQPLMASQRVQGLFAPHNVSGAAAAGTLKAPLDTHCRSAPKSPPPSPRLAQTRSLSETGSCPSGRTFSSSRFTSYLPSYAEV